VINAITLSVLLHSQWFYYTIGDKRDYIIGQLLQYQWYRDYIVSRYYIIGNYYIISCNNLPSLLPAVIIILLCFIQY